MWMRRLLLSIMLAIFLSAGLNPGLEASEQWCSGDPVEVIITSGGLIVPVYVTSSALGIEHLVTVQTAQISDTTTSTKKGTVVSMTVVVPNDAFGSSFPTASVVSVGPDATSTILAQTSGYSGQPMNMEFELSEPYGS
jgi:hypothetical protein